MRHTLIILLASVGLVGCIGGPPKAGLTRPNFSKPAAITSGTAPVKSRSCGCGGCSQKVNKPSLMTPTDPPKDVRPSEELPEFSDEFGSDPI